MSSTISPARTRPRSLVNLAATIVGVTFVLVGILGFIPVATTNLDDLQFAGYESNALLLGLFQVSVLHNIVHLLFGVVGLAAGRATVGAARGYLVGGGVIYLVLWVYGLVLDQNSDVNFVPLNDADNWLHLGLGIGMIGLGMALYRRISSRV